MQVQTILTFADYDPFPGESDFGIGSVTEIGHEQAFPHGRALSALHVLNVENFSGESLVENSRLDFEGDLRAFEAVFQMAERGLGPWGDVEAVEEGEEPRGSNKNRERTEEAPHAHATGAHGGNFAVGSQTAESNQDSEQDAHGERIGQGERDGKEKNLGDARQGSAGADD